MDSQGRIGLLRRPRNQMPIWIIMGILEWFPILTTTTTSSTVSKKNEIFCLPGHIENKSISLDLFSTPHRLPFKLMPFKLIPGRAKTHQLANRPLKPTSRGISSPTIFDSPLQIFLPSIYCRTHLFFPTGFHFVQCCLCFPPSRLSPLPLPGEEIFKTSRGDKEKQGMMKHVEAGAGPWLEDEREKASEKPGEAEAGKGEGG